MLHVAKDLNSANSMISFNNGILCVAKRHITVAAKTDSPMILIMGSLALLLHCMFSMNATQNAVFTIHSCAVKQDFSKRILPSVKRGYTLDEIARMAQLAAYLRSK